MAKRTFLVTVEEVTTEDLATRPTRPTKEGGKDRHQAALRAWETRRARQAKRTRREAARKAWITRRANGKG